MLTDTDALAELLGATDETLLRRPLPALEARHQLRRRARARLRLGVRGRVQRRRRRQAGQDLEQAPAGSVLLVDRQLCVLVARPSADRDLPALSDLTRRLRSCGGKRMRPRGPSDAVQTLAYKPLRRWVGTLSTGRRQIATRRRALLSPRAYRPGDLERARANLKTARRLFGGLTPNRSGVSRRRGLIVQAWVPGEPLDRALAAGTAPADTLPTVGRTLAGMHQRQPPSLRGPRRRRTAGRHRRAARSAR